MSFLGGKGNNNISIGKAKSKFSFCYHLGCSTIDGTHQRDAGTPTPHLGACQTFKADAPCQLSIMPDGCSQSKADGARRMQGTPHRYCQYHAAPSWEPARRSTIIEPANIPSGASTITRAKRMQPDGCREPTHRYCQSKADGMQHHLGTPTTKTPLL